MHHTLTCATGATGAGHTMSENTPSCTITAALEQSMLQASSHALVPVHISHSGLQYQQIRLNYTLNLPSGPFSHIELLGLGSAAAPLLRTYKAVQTLRGTVSFL